MTAPRLRPFAQLDMFSFTPYLGNSVAVVLDSSGLDDEAMRRVALWTNLSGRRRASLRLPSRTRLGTAQEVLGLEPDLLRIPTAMVGAVGAYPAGAERLGSRGGRNTRP